MCTRPLVITLLPSLCRTPACISTHVSRASANVSVRALCVISLPSPHSCGCVHSSVLGKHPDWAKAHFVKPPLHHSQGCWWCLLGAPVRPVWPLNTGRRDQLSEWGECREPPCNLCSQHGSTLGSKLPFLFLHVTREHFHRRSEVKPA